MGQCAEVSGRPEAGFHFQVETFHKATVRVIAFANGRRNVGGATTYRPLRWAGRESSGAIDWDNLRPLKPINLDESTGEVRCRDLTSSEL